MLIPNFLTKHSTDDLYYYEHKLRSSENPMNSSQSDDHHIMKTISTYVSVLVKFVHTKPVITEGLEELMFGKPLDVAALRFQELREIYHDCSHCVIGPVSNLYTAYRTPDYNCLHIMESYPYDKLVNEIITFKPTTNPAICKVFYVFLYGSGYNHRIESQLQELYDYVPTVEYLSCDISTLSYPTSNSGSLGNSGGTH